MTKHIGAILTMTALLAGGCAGSKSGAPKSGGGEGLDSIMAARNLTPDDAAAALKTFMPSGRIDDYILFASGGHSGQVFVVGLPSMRLLRSISVFTPEPWQGYGYGVGEDILKDGYANGRETAQFVERVTQFAAILESAVPDSTLVQTPPQD